MSRSSSSAAGAALITVGLQSGRYLTGLLALVVLARLLQPADYGVVTMAWAVVGLASVIGDLGLSLAALRAPSLTEGQKSNLFWLNGAVGLGIGVLVALLSGPIAAFYGEPRLQLVTLALASVFIVNGFSVQLKVEVNRQRRFTALGMIDVGGQLVGVASALALALLQFGYWALVFQQIVGAFVSIALAVILARWRPGWPRRGEAMHSMLSFGRDTLALQTANYVTSNVDSVALGQQLGPSILGIYNRAFQIVVLPLNQVMAPLTRVFVPYLADAHAAGRLDDALRRVEQRVVMMVVAPIGLLIVVATPLVTVVLGERWTPAGTLVSILAVGALFQALGYVYYWAFLTLGRTGKLFASELWGRVPMVALVLIFTNRSPLWVAAVVSSGQILIWLAGSCYYGPRSGIPVKRLLTDNRAALFSIACATLIGVFSGFHIGGVPDVVQLILLASVWLVVAFAVGVWFPSVRASVKSLTPLLERLRGRRRASPTH